MYSVLFDLHAELFKALSHPKRLEIINLLRDQSLNVSQIQQMLDLHQANLSQHLMVLRNSRMVVTKKVGKEIYYSLAQPKLIQACDLLREVLLDVYKDYDLHKASDFKMNEYLPLVTDPVCGMRISPKTAGSSFKYLSKNYYFCASGCMAIFKKNPQSHFVV